MFTDDKGNYETLEILVTAELAGFKDFSVRQLNDKEMTGKVCKSRDASSGMANVPCFEAGDG